MRTRASLRFPDTSGRPFLGRNELQHGRCSCTGKSNEEAPWRRYPQTPSEISPLSFLPIFPFGGAYRTADHEATAFGGDRETRYVVTISATATSPEDYEAERSWSRSFWTALVEHADGIGSYVNFMTEYEEDRVARPTGTSTNDSSRSRRPTIPTTSSG